MRRPTIQVLRPKLRAAEFRTVLPPKKVPDPELTTEAHRKWRQEVLRRAGFCCQKCGADGRSNRLFADHIKERRDGGALLDVNNGQALCSSCHVKKGMRERARRMHDHTNLDE